MIERSILVSLLTSLLLLGGCASLSEGECRRGDWYDIGLRDGLAGNPVQRLDEHARACAEHGVGIDSNRYFDGHAEGVREYCQLGNAFRTGLRGEGYQGVCPPGLDRTFRAYNEAALAVHRDKQEFERLSDRLNYLERQLIEDKLSDTRRKEIRVEIRDLDRQMFLQRSTLRQSERHLDLLMDEARLAPR